jgi:hypothetical protein
MSEPNEMTCAELADVAAELALGVLTGRERAAAVAHLEWCESCREDVRQLMATGEQLLGLLPPVEPPAGFETRVLERLGLPTPALGHAELLQTGRPRRRRRLLGRGARPASDNDGHGATGALPGGTTDPGGMTSPGGMTGPAGTAPGGTAPGGTGPGATGPSGTGPGRSGRSRPGGSRRVRRALSAVAVVVALFAAGFGGWRVGTGPAPAVSASHQVPLAKASLVSATGRDVGDVFLYSGKERWMYMTVDLGGGNELVTCQVLGTDGQVSTIGTFNLAGGYGGWGSPDPGNAGAIKGARLVDTDGTVLATASFDW